MNTSRQRFTQFLFLVCLAFGTGHSALSDTIAVIGTGRVANALGPAFAKQGHTIIYGSRDQSKPEVIELVNNTGSSAKASPPYEAAALADIVVLAVPGSVAQEVAANLGDLSRKILIDPTNQFAQGEDGFISHPSATSNAQDLQAAYPNAHVVKAFNTLGVSTMGNPQEAGGPVSIPIAGNNTEAKEKVALLANKMGLESIDVGPVRFAHVLEGMLVLWSNARRNDAPFNYYLRPNPVD